MHPLDYLWVIPVFGLLIFIHELGHFAVAKYFDIRVHEFALGFGPVLFGFERGETRYNLRAIPLGGFVRMAGMDESDAEDDRGFNRKPIFARAAVIFAGPFMNFVLASVIYSGLVYFVPQPVSTPILGDLQQTCQSQAGGAAAPCPAVAAGLRSGDLVLKIDGKPITDWRQIYDTVGASDGRPVTFVVQRDQETRQVTIQPIQSNERWVIGILPAMRSEPLGRALVQGPVMTGRISVAILQSLGRMVTGQEAPQLAGPVNITKEIAKQASRGLDELLPLVFMLSVNLGLFNLLPIPALDGSRLLFMVIEVIRGRRVDPRRENMVHFVGFLILIGLMVVITYGEIMPR